MLIADAGLQDSVTFDDDIGHGMNDGALHGMSDGTDQFVSGVARKLGVGIERDDVLDSGQQGIVAGDYGKIVKLAKKQVIQVEQFAALALPTHPGFFDGVVSAIAVKQEKSCLGHPGRSDD